MRSTGDGFHNFRRLSRKLKQLKFSMTASLGDVFQHFRLSRKSKKSKFSMTVDLSKICHFCYFHIFAYISSKCVNIYILVVVRSTGNGFHNFRRLSRKLKQLKFSMTASLLKICHVFATFNCFAYFSSK